MESVDNALKLVRPAKKPRQATPAYPIESVDNALKLLLMFRERAQIRVSEASRAIGVAPSTAHRLLAMLQHHGFVQQDADSRAYVAGPALLEVGLSVVRDMDIRNRARPFIEALSEETGETVHLAVLQGAEVLFLDAVESSKALRVASRTGRRLPAHCTSSGKALLAELPPARLRELYPVNKLPVVTARSISTWAQLERELLAVRDRGYATNFGESEDDVGSVSVVVKDHRGRHLGAISVAAPLSRMSDADLPSLAEAAQRTARKIGDALS
jgi:DNA-binding IclR family transcriptional regulator